MLLNETNLDWKVRTEAVKTADSGLIIPNTISIVREDTNKPLSTMKKGYRPFQNYELFELLEKVTSSTGLPIIKSGYFGNGEKIYIQLKSNDLKIGNDKIEGYLTGVNSFDGSTSLAFGPSNITISCENKFFAAFRGLKFKVRHTKNMLIKVEDILRSIDATLIEEKELFDNIIKLSETKISDDSNIDDVIRMLFDIEDDIDIEDEEAISTAKRNKIEDFYVDLNGELKSKGDNLWGLFSGVTKYTTHTMNKGNTDKNLQNKMFGVYGERERNIFNKMVALI